MLVKELLEKLQSFSPDKQIICLPAHMDPFYYEDGETDPNAVTLILFEERDIWEIVETDTDNKITKKEVIVG